jgi:hypothetical protein
VVCREKRPLAPLSASVASPVLLVPVPICNAPARFTLSLKLSLVTEAPQTNALSPPRPHSPRALYECY